jgi:hypothetical protein
MKNIKNFLLSEQKFEIIYIIFFCLFLISLFVECVKITGLVFTHHFQEIQKLIPQIFVIFFVFLLFSIIWKALSSRTMGIESALSYKISDINSGNVYKAGHK